jgi:hypothetical protein
MEKDFNIYKNSIFEKIKNEYQKIEELNNKNEAKKRMIQYQRKGYYFSFCILKNGKWRLYIG